MKDFWDHLAHDLRALIKNPASCLVCAYALYVAIRIRQGHTDQTELLSNVVALLGCAVFAILSDSLKRSQILEELRRANKNDSPIQVHKTWHTKESREATARIKKSFAMVDTFFDEAPNLSTSIQEAIDAGAKDLTLQFYMLSPDAPYGGQRLRELNPANKDKPPADLEVLYRAQFNECVSAIIQRLQPLPRVTLEIFEYSTMPSVRLMVLDDVDYFFGYFPLNAANPLHGCLSAHANKEECRPVVQDLRRQFAEIQGVSKLVYTSHREQRPLRELNPSLKGA